MGRRRFGQSICGVLPIWSKKVYKDEELATIKLHVPKVKIWVWRKRKRAKRIRISPVRSSETETRDRPVAAATHLLQKWTRGHNITAENKA
jgi:hypothetical protein